MARRLVNVDRNTAMLLPPDLRAWVPESDVVHFVVDAVEEMALPADGVNERGTGSEQYPPGMMLGLLIYCYLQGIYSSRAIERATHTHVGVRYLTGDTHPDHDTIATFRKKQDGLFRRVFVEVLQLAQRLQVPRLGTVCLDGTKLKANASSRHNRRESQLREELRQLEAEVNRCVTAAAAAEAQDQSDPMPLVLHDRQKRRQKIAAARAAITRRAAEQDRDVNDEEQGNTTDPDSRVQRSPQGFIQGYNAQLAVSAESGLIVGARVCDAAHDRQQLAPTVAAIPASAGQAHTFVADTGYDNQAQITVLEQNTDAQVCVPPQLPLVVKNRQSAERATLTKARCERHERTQSAWGKRLLRLRRTVVEPVFGTLKHAWRFTRFQARGLVGTNNEWLLVCLAYNLRKLHRWQLGQPN